MPNSTDQFSQNSAPQYPPGLPRTPGGSVIFVEATPPPPAQNAADQLAHAEAVAAAANATPLVINDTFDGADPTPYPRRSLTPPLTQRPRAGQYLDESPLTRFFGNVNAEAGNEPQIFAHASAQDAAQANVSDPLAPASLVSSISQWGSSQTAAESLSSSPISVTFTASETTSQASLAPRTAPATAVEADLQAQATTATSDTASLSENTVPAGQLAGNMTVQGIPAQAREAAEDDGMDYFALFYPLPSFDPTHYMNTSLPGMPRDAEDRPPLPTPGQRQRPPMVNGRVSSSFSGGAPHAFYLGEHPNSPSPVVHSKNDKKRVWLGSPNAEELRRATRRQRPDDPVPVHESLQRLTVTGYDDCNPWRSGREEMARGDFNRVNDPGFAFNPVTASTPTRTIHASSRDPPTQGAPPASSLRPARTHPAAPDVRVPSLQPPPAQPSRSLARQARPPPQDTDECREDEDVLERASVPPQQNNARHKGKGKARAEPDDLDENEEACDPPVPHREDWDEAEIR